MKKKSFNGLINVVIVTFIIVTAFFLFGNSHNSSTQDSLRIPTAETGTLAQCLTEKGVVMYGAEWCPHCKNQKAMFGAAVSDINFVDCEKNREECVDNGIKGYPTWKIDGKLYPGERSLSSLKELSGC